MIVITRHAWAILPLPYIHYIYIYDISFLCHHGTYSLNSACVPDRSHELPWHTITICQIRQDRSVHSFLRSLDPLIVRGTHHDILHISCKTVLINSPNRWEALQARFLSSPHPFRIFSTHLLGTWSPAMRQFPSHMVPFTLQHSLAQRKEENLYSQTSQMSTSIGAGHTELWRR